MHDNKKKKMSTKKFKNYEARAEYYNDSLQLWGNQYLRGPNRFWKKYRIRKAIKSKVEEHYNEIASFMKKIIRSDKIQLLMVFKKENIMGLLPI